MPVYRYKSVGVNIAAVQAAVPGSLVLGATGTAVYVDITAPSGSKPDLDDVMVTFGWAYDSADPVVTPAEEAATETAAAFTYGSPGNVGTSNAGGVATTVPRSDHTHALSEATLRAVAAVITADFSVNGQQITNVGNPSSGDHAANKDYVDAVASGLQPKAAVRVGTTANITLSGTQTIDGVAVIAGDRVLVKNQSSGVNNGIYVVAAGAWSRASDLAAASHAKNVYMFISEGSTLADQLWICTTNAPTDVVGTDSLTFQYYQAGAGVSPARQIIAGAGLTGGGDLTADRTLAIGANADGSITVNADDIQVGILATDAQHGSRGGGTQHAAVIAAGAAGFMSGADKTKLDGIATGATNTALTASAPADVTKAAAGVGVATDAARADHKHDVSTAAPTTIDAANSEGTSTSLARADHTHDHGSQTVGTHHAVVIAAGASGFMTGADKTKLDGIASGATATPLATVAPVDVTKATAVIGVSTKAAKEDHKHDVSTAVPVAIDGANAEGTSTALSRADHVHSHGAQTDGTMHAVATGATAGFMSTANFTKLSGIATGATNTPLATVSPVNVTKATAVIGVSTEAAKADHKHDITTAAGAANPPGTSNAEGTSTSLSRADHTHSMPTYGSTSGTICQGNDSRLSDDRIASGIRTATTAVSCSGATAPTAGQVLTATSGTAATWQTPAASGGNYRQSVFAKISIDTTTTSTTWVDLISQAVTITASGILIIHLTAAVSNSAVNKSVQFRVTVDGVSQGGFGIELKSAGVSCSGAIVVRVTGLSTGTHTIKARWQTSSGTAQIRPVGAPDTESANLLIEEVAA